MFMSSFIELLVIIIILIILFIINTFIQEILKGKKMNTENNSLLRTIPVNDVDNVIRKVNAKRDELYTLISRVSKKLEIPIKCIKSSSINTSTWLTCSVTNSIEPYISKEANVIIVIESLPFHEYDTIVSLEINTNNYQKTFEQIIEFNEDDIVKILQILVSDNGKIKYKPKRYSNWKIIFWRPKNNLIKKYDKKFNIFKIFPISILYIPFGIIKGVYNLFYRLFVGRKSYYKVTMGKPKYEPRHLVKLDSWQTVVASLGGEKERIVTELQIKLTNLDIQEGSFRVKKEKIWYWGIHGKEEREQLACIFNRGYVFVHIYSYGNDLYVGWDANLNYATWQEYKVADGYTNGKVQNIELYGIEPIWKEVNEYDLDDTNFLLETVHANITQIIKRMMKEKKIDQEIDFTIVRESRKDALMAEKPQEDRRSKFKRLD